MNKRVWESITRSNGYLCGCCRGSFDEENWIEPSEMIPIEEIIDKALNVNPSDEYSATSHQYYDEGENGIYGFWTSYGRDYCNIYIGIGEKDYMIKEDGKQLIEKEELIKKYQEFLTSEGEGK